MVYVPTSAADFHSLDYCLNTNPYEPGIQKWWAGTGAQHFRTYVRPWEEGIITTWTHELQDSGSDSSEYKDVDTQVITTVYGHDIGTKPYPYTTKKTLDDSNFKDIAMAGHLYYDLSGHLSAQKEETASYGPLDAYFKLYSPQAVTIGYKITVRGELYQSNSVDSIDVAVGGSTLLSLTLDRGIDGEFSNSGRLVNVVARADPYELIVEGSVHISAGETEGSIIFNYTPKSTDLSTRTCTFKYFSRSDIGWWEQTAGNGGVMAKQSDMLTKISDSYPYSFSYYYSSNNWDYTHYASAGRKTLPPQLSFNGTYYQTKRDSPFSVSFEITGTGAAA